MDEKEYLTTQDVAELLGISVFTVRRYIRDGKLNAVRLEKSYRIRRKDLEAFLEGRETGGGRGGKK